MTAHATIIPDDYPELRLITWNRDRSRPLPAEEVFQIYEANWRHVDQRHLTDAERTMIEYLAATYGAGYLLVPK